MFNREKIIIILYFINIIKKKKLKNKEIIEKIFFKDYLIQIMQLL